MSRFPRIVILHEWDGRPYYEALDRLARDVTGRPPIYREVWLIRQMAIGLIRRNSSLILKSLRNIRFFLETFFLKDCVVVLGIAPFDPAMLFWSRLLRRNKVIYHTSWLKWDGSDVPKRSIAFHGLVVRQWKRFLEDERVHIVSILPETKTEMLRHYAKDPRLMSVIPHSLDLQLFKPRKNGPEKVLKVAYVGRLNSRKGIDVLAELIRDANPARFRFGVAGEGPEWKRLEPLTHLFDYHGFLRKKSEVAELLSGYDIMVLPSHFEPFGIALIEAMACGVVCIVSNGLFPKDLILNGENGFIVPRTTHDFLSALDRLERDRSLLATMRDRGLARVKEFEVELVGEKWRALIEHM